MSITIKVSYHGGDPGGLIMIDGPIAEQLNDEARWALAQILRTARERLESNAEPLMKLEGRTCRERERALPREDA